MTLVLRYIARSDRGLVRSNNEDSVYAGARLLALADGMGGHAAGEVASQLVIQSLRTLDDDEPPGNLLDALDAATRAGNEAIAAQVDRNPELDGMGTTLTAILFAGSRIGLCHVGDSRGYLLRDGQLTQITRDDTFVQTLVDEGRITAEQAHTHPQRSLIMKALTGQEVEPTLTIREARAGDRYLLCSDGLSDVVSEETLSDTLSTVTDHTECADRLIELALRSGAPDNVTVVVADVVDTQYGESRPILGGAAGTDDQAGYVPNPKTAAGRAAALRPPPEPTQRPTLNTDPDPEPPRRPWRLPLLVLAGVVLLVLLVTGFFVVRSKAMENYFVSEDGGSVVIKRGTPESLLFIDFEQPGEKVCIVNPKSEEPEVTFMPADSGTACLPMKVSDLTDFSQTTVQSKSIKNLGLRDVQQRVRELELRRLCQPLEVPEGDQPTAPTPAPHGSEPHPAPSHSAAPTPTSAPETSTDAEEGHQPCREG
ncbi:MAG: protein phosphatase 2C domain-containing protein [Gordonia sp. (in: high G+C Gram-positive bacteria)]|uniref:PP2C family protein-serine/threonine phosphatase n=1 Tax=Gordonia sp. (in: high G+C Gram-positive bacteria) TaxID=84139 RepID=UPI0039E39A15